MSINYSDLKRTGLATLAKVFAALSAFIVTTIIARGFSTESAGYFFISFTFFSFLNIFYKLGLDSIILREVASKGIVDSVSDIYTRVLYWINIAQIPFFLVFFILGNWICQNVLDKPKLYDVMFWFIASLPFAMFYLFYSSISQGKGQVIRATFYQNLGVSIIFIPLLIIAVWGVKWEIYKIALLYFFANLVVFCRALYELLLKTEYKFRKVKLWDENLFISCKSLWLGSIMTLLVWWGSIVISSFVLSSDNVAVLSAAQRTAYITSFILMVSNMAMAPRFSRLWFDNDIELLKRTVVKMTRLLIMVAFPVLLAIMLFPSSILRIFGERYTDASSALILFALGQFTNIIAGSASPLLNMTGNEHLYKIASLFGGGTAIFLGIGLTYFYGISGAAASTAIAMLIQNIVLVYFVKKKFNFYMFV